MASISITLNNSYSINNPSLGIVLNNTYSVSARKQIISDAQELQVRYLCSINDELYPMSSFQLRKKRAGNDFLSVVLPGWTAETCGFVVGDVVKVIRSVVMSDGSVIDTEMASITATQLLDNFGNSGNTLVVNCSQVAGAVSAQSFEISKVNSVGTSVTGPLFRMLPRHEMRPGDTIIYLDVEYTVDQIVFIVGTDNMIMELNCA